MTDEPTREDLIRASEDLIRELANQMQDMLEDTALYALQLDTPTQKDEVDCVSANYKYAEQDAINALMILSHVLSNIYVHHLMEEEIPLQRALDGTNPLVNELREVFSKLAGFDPRLFLNKQKNANN
jgi:hypothetical protein